MNRIERSFAEVRGKLCWGVNCGFGSFLTLEFGPPHLVVRQLRAPMPPDVSPRVRRALARRAVHARGRWHLWIYCCAWFVRANGRLVGDWTTKRRIDRAARELNGQKLLDVTIPPRGARTRFLFDAGVELETKPYDRSSEQWLFYEPDGNVLVWRADRRYQHGPGNRSSKRLRWRALAR